MELSKNQEKVLKTLGIDKLMAQWDIAATLCTTTGRAAERQHRDIYPRVHESIAYLEKEDYVRVYGNAKSARGMPKKMYGLTLKGAITFLALIKIRSPRSSIAGESAEEREKRYTKERIAYKEEFRSLAKIIVFYGQVLDFPLFKETKWLLDMYGPEAVYALLDSAKYTQQILPPMPSEKPALFDFFGDFFTQIKKGSESYKPAFRKYPQKDREWSTFLRYLRQKFDPKNYAVRYQPSNERIVSKQKFHEFFVDLEQVVQTYPHNTQREILEKTAKILGSQLKEGYPDQSTIKDLMTYLTTFYQALEKEYQLWSDETLRLTFAAHFARRFQNSKPRYHYSTEELSNETLAEFFRQSAIDIKHIEVEPSEKLAEMFGIYYSKMGC